MVIDSEGRDYFDLVLGYGSVVLGHSNERYRREVDRYSQHGTLLPGYTTWHTRLLEELLQGSLPDYQAAFFKTASEANTAAIRLCAGVSGKKKIIRCGFLGWHDALLGNSVRWHECPESPLRSTLRFTRGFRGTTGDEEVLNWTSLDVDDLNELVNCHVDGICCFVVDMYQTRFTNVETIRNAARLCRQQGIFVVADETKLSGRVSPLGLANQMGIDPDFVVIGKALGNGAPISILLGRSELMMHAEDFRITGTFSSELTAVFSALATLQEMRCANGYEALCLIGHDICFHFNEAAKLEGAENMLSAVALFGGAMFEMEFGKPILGDLPRRQSLCVELARQGVLVLQGHPSYVCLEHKHIDALVLRERIQRGIRSWFSKPPHQ